MRIYPFLLALLCFSCMGATAQTVNQNTGWLFLMNNNKLSEKWGTHFDFQLRSQNEWDGVRNVLIRPGLTYFINKNNDVTLGYLFTQTHTNIPGAADHTATEHRIWQQYIHKHKISKVNVSHRFRLEQRFIERHNADDLFAQRFRYFARFLLPLAKEVQNFEHGVFVALQNEIFLNIHHKNDLNGHVFDQNRAYAATGYRFSKHIDAEAGYMNQSVKGASANTSNHIIQVAVYTRF